MITLICIAVIFGMGGFLVGQARGLQLERNRARRHAAALVHPAGSIARPRLAVVPPKDGA